MSLQQHMPVGSAGQVSAGQVSAGRPARGASLPQVNLLPPEIAEARAFRTLQAGLGAGLLAVVGVVGLLYVQANGSVGDAQTELDQATAQTATVQQQVNQYGNVTAVYAAVDARETMLTRAMGHEVRWSNTLVNLSLGMPDNSWLDTLTVAQTDDTATAPAAQSASPVTGPAVIGTLTFAGHALAHADVAVWLEALAQQPAVVNPYFTSSQENYVGTTKVVDVASSAVVTADAYSNRYTQPGGGAR